MTRTNKYTYRYVKPDEQYLGCPIEGHLTKIVDAQYINTGAFEGNPYIEALPFPRTSTQQVLNTYNFFPELPSFDEYMEMPQFIQNAYLSKMENIRIALPYHKDIENKLYNTIVSSYDKRAEARVNSVVDVENIPYAVSTGLFPYPPNESVSGFSVLGVTGTGKSTALTIALDHYPQVIKHHFGSRTVIQIVYLVVNCEGCKNFSALYQAIGRQIDTALNNGNSYYEKAIKAERLNGQKSLKVRELIRIFNIGCIIFDEIQKIDLKANNENSIGALLTINNDSHVGMGVIGTEDAFHDIFKQEMLARRFDNYVASGRYCEDWKSCCSIVRALFSSCRLFREPVIPDEDTIRAFAEITGGVISYFLEVFILVLRDYLSKNGKPVINADYIRTVAKKDWTVMHNLKMEQMAYSPSAIARRKLINDMNCFNIDEKKKRDEREFIEESLRSLPDAGRDAVIAAIAEEHREYNRGTIENAVDVVMRRGIISELEVEKKALEHLKKGKTDRRKTKSKMTTTVDQMRKSIEGLAG